MKPLELGRELVQQLLLPLMRGGDVRPLQPVGEALALELEGSLADAGVFEPVAQLKLRAARRLYPLNELGELAGEEWLLLCALNDLLQLMNPTLSRRFFTAENQLQLSELVGRVIERAGPPRTVQQALSRDALFSEVVLLVRRDTSVNWWTGSRQFVGRQPPSRLMVWPELRRVRQRTQAVPIQEMGQESANFARLFERWLATTPLTLFHEAGKAGSRFAWVGSALALTRTPLGRDLALRALLLSLDVPRALDVLSRATLALQSIDTEAFDHANGFVHAAISRHKQLNQQQLAVAPDWAAAAAADA